MRVEEAREIIDELYYKTTLTKEEEFMYIESLKFLIEEEQDPEDMMHLGGLYYEMKKFDLALKYYNMASNLNYEKADECLGYIYYYGRVGERDYEKAYFHYKRSADMGNIVSAYKIADMYKNGYFVEKDYEKYKSIIKKLYPKVRKMTNVFSPVPEVFTRLAGIYVEENKKEDAISLYLYSKNFLAQRIKYNAFFGNISIMKWIINDLYKIYEFDYYNFDFYDLFYLLNKPSKVTFMYENKKYEVVSLMEDGELIVSFNNKWYHSVFDFFAYASIGDLKLNNIYDELYNFIYESREE